MTLEKRKSHVEAVSRDGRSIRCKWLIFASGYEFPEIVPAKGHRITTTWAFATRPQRRRLWPEECLIWEASKPYLYMRTTPDGRVLCGGEDAETSDALGRPGVMERKIARLQGKVGKLFPDIDTRAAFTWSAAFGETATGLAADRRNPRSSELLCGARLWRQRHHLQPDRGRNPALGADRRTRSRCGSLRLQVKLTSRRSCPAAEMR